MSQPTPADDLNARVKTMQIILGAIVLGAIIFLTIAVYHRSQSGQPAVEGPPPDTWMDHLRAAPFSYAAMVVGLVLAVLYYLATDWVATAQRRKIARGVPDLQRSWYAAYGTTLIVGAVLLEAAAFVFILAYLSEGSWEKNKMPAFGALAFIAFLISLFPTRPRVESWLKEQQAKLKAEQSGRR